MTTSLNMERLQIGFFDQGLDYYVAGRFGILKMRSTVVAGNLFHHAIEMFLKGILVKSYSLQELEYLRHSLPKLWNRIKEDFASINLKEFDTTIQKLHRFEKIRYPDRVVSEGANFTIGVRSGDDKTKIWPKPKPETIYQLALEDLDKLVKILFEISNNNLKFYLGMMGEDAKAMLTEQNFHSII